MTCDWDRVGKVWETQCGHHTKVILRGATFCPFCGHPLIKQSDYFKRQAYQKAYYEANKERLKERSREYMREYQRRRRAKEKLTT